MKENKNKVPPESGLIHAKMEYMYNCLQWLEWYSNGEVSAAMAHEGLDKLEIHIKQIRARMQSVKPPQP